MKKRCSSMCAEEFSMSWINERNSSKILSIFKNRAVHQQPEVSVGQAGNENQLSGKASEQRQAPRVCVSLLTELNAHCSGHFPPTETNYSSLHHGLLLQQHQPKWEDWVFFPKTQYGPGSGFKRSEVLNTNYVILESVVHMNISLTHFQAIWKLISCTLPF